MKKVAFKILTYISIFLVLPILKLFGKKYYETKVVPKLLTVLCNTKPNHYQRKKVVPLATGDVVEIGVGPGLNLQYYNFEKVNKVIGIDPSDELNKIAKKNADKVNLDIEFNLSSAESIDLPTSSVDSVVCTFSLCSIPDPNKALNEIFRILKPGGKYFFCEHGISPDTTTRVFQNVTNIFYPKLSGGCHANRDIPKLITDAGLNIVEKDTMYLPGSVKFLGYNYWGVAVR
ncbi:class I SAM-dependent methyltransferase [Acidimicrobiaceae bacterium]|nr:class I SAM-dependent methyltransferase [Acidimicrobiaceae bacterium]